MGGRRILGGVLGLLLCLIWATPASAVNKEFFGLSGWAPPNATPHDDWQQIGAAGVGTWRTPMTWKNIELNEPTPNPGGCAGEQVQDAQGYHCYRWGASGFDTVVENAARQGIRVVPYAFESPAWATGCGKCPPVDDEDGHVNEQAHWKTFIGQAALRYGEGGAFWEENPELDEGLYVKWIQAWNEPNFNQNWCHAGENDAECTVSAKEYGELVKDTCDAANGVADTCEGLEPSEPKVKVLLAGLPETFQPEDTRMIKFLRNVYAKVPKVKRYFQGVALHPFAEGKEGVRGAVLRAKDAMKDYGGWKYHNARVPIWITEFGWATNGPGDDPCVEAAPENRECRRAPSVAYKTDWAGQRKKLKKTYRMLASHAYDYHLSRAVWFSHQDNYSEGSCCDTGTWARYTGLFFRDAYEMNPPEPKPAWCGYIEVANELVPGPNAAVPLEACAPPPKP